MVGAATFVELTLVSLVQRGIEKEVERIRHDMARQRGEEFAHPTPGATGLKLSTRTKLRPHDFPESVEWVNAFLKVVWGLVDPQMFVPIADVVEDVMQQSLPGFIDAVRISGKLCIYPPILLLCSCSAP